MRNNRKTYGSHIICRNHCVSALFWNIQWLQPSKATDILHSVTSVCACPFGYQQDGMSSPPAHLRIASSPSNDRTISVCQRTLLSFRVIILLPFAPVNPNSIVWAMSFRHYYWGESASKERCRLLVGQSAFLPFRHNEEMATIWKSIMLIVRQLTFWKPCNLLNVRQLKDVETLF